eukprot:364027-Amorphochlora_amoeboformis.AAC.1
MFLDTDMTNPGASQSLCFLFWVPTLGSESSEVFDGHRDCAGALCFGIAGYPPPSICDASCHEISQSQRGVS